MRAKILLGMQYLFFKDFITLLKGLYAYALYFLKT